VDTAFITIPGHIYMAFSLGPELSAGMPEQDLIRSGDQWWMPVEITATNKGFLRAWRLGAQEWRNAGAEARLYPMKESWAVYPPVSVPDATRRAPALPEERVFVAALEQSLNTLGEFIIRDTVLEMERSISRAAGAQLRLLCNDLGILYGRYGILDKAAAAFNRAGDSDAMINLGHLAFIEGRYQDAIRRYQQVILNQSEDSQSWLGIARALYGSGDFPRAGAAYADVVHLNPALAGLYPYLGSYREWQGRPRSYADRLGSTVWASSAAMQELQRIAEGQLAAERLAAEQLATEQSAAAPTPAITAGPAVQEPIARAGGENETPAFYVVKHRDTLANIARLSFVYADGTQWPLLYEANKSTLPEPDNPNLIIPGLVLRIPPLRGEAREGTR
jgi:tetratricopeptide (TPR) repeat protein